MTQQPVKILVVDDEPGIRESCRKVLESEGFHVETAVDGVEGLELFKKNASFEAVLVDLKMPRMGGIELIRQIKQIDPEALLLVITAYATIETAVEATKRGAYGYIPKPFTPDELLLPVHNGLEKRALAIEARQLREEREMRLLEVAYERSRCGTIIQCMSDAILVVNIEGQIVLRNAAASQILPWECLAQLPCSLACLDSPALKNLLEETVKASSKPNIVSREVSFDKSTYMVNASPVIDDNGRVLGGLVLLRDITALKKLAAAKSMFVSMVAHELKSPLAAVEGLLDIVLYENGKVSPERERNLVERALLKTTTLRQLIDELMSLRALEAGRFALSRSALNLQDVLAEVLEACREKADRHSITLASNLETSRQVPDVFADRDAMKSIFTNIIDNAIKYTARGGSVSVDTAHNDQYMTITIQDNGIGMDPEEQEKIFEEFFRARNEFTAGIPGTGLGLSLTKHLIDMHHGKIRVESSPGKGSVFTVCIPLVSEVRKNDSR